LDGVCGIWSGIAMYDVFKDFAGPIATIIAALAAVGVTAYFAWHQKRIAEAQASISKEKLRHDLFERRWAVFDSIFDFYEAMISWKGTPEQIAARTRFFRAYQNSHFLFSPESGVERLLKELNDGANKVIGFKENGADWKDQDRALWLRQFNEVQEIQTVVFENGLTRLKNAMSDYLSFHDV
jgi:hypothetical protein